MTAPIRVLVVDDSAFARKVVREVLSLSPHLEVVGIARDGLDALEKMLELKPDVITLDLVMPGLDGIGVLRALEGRGDAPRVVVVSVSGPETDLAIEALELGAVELVTKPTPLPTDRLYELSRELVSRVKAAARARPPRRASLAAEPPLAPLSAIARPDEGAPRLGVVGTSTGGPQALTHLFSRLPRGLPIPLAVALHIPPGYTPALAARLSQLGGVPVDEARHGMELLPGRAALAPGGMHLRIRCRSGQFFAEVGREPLETLHHPSVDLLFESAAEAAGPGALGLIMTGMGEDGLRGARAIREAGGRMLAESEESCVVYGMPRAVIEAGLATDEARLERIPELLVRTICASYPQGCG